MPYRSLLVHLDDLPRCATRVDVAVRLARRYESHLVGLSPTGRLPASPEGASGIFDIQTLQAAWSTMRQIAEERVVRFKERCEHAGLVSCEGVVDEEDAGVSLARHAHCSDLVIVGQPDPQTSPDAASRAVAEQAILNGARPALVIPYAGPIETVGMDVLVAWNDSRESARAVADALPMLRDARRVRLMQCESPLEAQAPDRKERIESVRKWLVWHGVDADAQVEATEIDVGNALLSRAADMGADLIVMGAYGHARWTERVLGGATRTLLSSMTIPVLMSH